MTRLERGIWVSTLLGISLFFGQTMLDPLDSQSPTSLQSPYADRQARFRRRPEFEVISIRPSGRNTGFTLSRTPDSLTATHQSLTALVLLAYLPIPLWSGDKVRNKPIWAVEEEYDVIAKVASEDIHAWQSTDGEKLQMAMLQSMLAERFKLVIHTEPSEIPGFALVVAKPRPGLRAAASGETLPQAAMGLSAGGVAVARGGLNGAVWTFYAAPMASLVDYLSRGSHTIIEDRTGLTGIYDFDLHRRDDADPQDHGDITDPASKWNFEDLGLKTIPSKVHSFNLIIDHVERPSPN